MLVHLEALILEYISEVDIFSRYFQYGFELSKRYRSPFRRDSNPSFNIFKKSAGYGTNEYLFKDYGTGHCGNCFNMISLIYGEDHFKAILRVIKDFNIPISDFDITLRMSVEGDYIHKDKIKPNVLIDTVTKDKEKTIISSYWVEWNNQYNHYWNRYGITLDTLQYYRVYPVNRATINSKYTIHYKEENPMYAYYYTFNGEEYTKLYRPLAKQFNESKFFSNCNSNVVAGLEQLWETQEAYCSDLLIITKSHKDMMILFEMGYCSISPLSETVMLKSDLLEILDKAFKTIIVLFDNDDTGIKYANMYPYKTIFINDVVAKDISDYVEEYGFGAGVKHLKQLINGI